MTLVRGFVGCDADLQELARLLKTRCGVGGTARAALKIANDWYEKPAGNRILTPAEVRRLTKLLLKRDHQARKQILRHCPDRVHTILPGIVLMDALTEALCGGELFTRQDDAEATITNRMKVYYKNTHPLIEYYRKKGKLIDVNSAQPPQAVFEEIKERIAEL